MHLRHIALHVSPIEIRKLELSTSKEIKDLFVDSTAIEVCNFDPHSERSINIISFILP